MLSLACLPVPGRSPSPFAERQPDRRSAAGVLGRRPSPDAAAAALGRARPPAADYGAPTRCPAMAYSSWCYFSAAGAGQCRRSGLIWQGSPTAAEAPSYDPRPLRWVTLSWAVPTPRRRRQSRPFGAAGSGWVQQASLWYPDKSCWLCSTVCSASSPPPAMKRSDILVPLGAVRWSCSTAGPLLLKLEPLRPLVRPAGSGRRRTADLTFTCGPRTGWPTRWSWAWPRG